MPTIARHCLRGQGSGWLMDTRMLAFILLLSHSEYTLLTCVAIAWQLGCGGAAVHTSGGQAESSTRVPWAQTEPGWQFRCVVARGVLILIRSKTDTATPCIDVLFPNRPFILTLPWWGFHVHEFQCNYISITLHVNNLKGKKEKENAITAAFLPEDAFCSF